MIVNLPYFFIVNFSICDIIRNMKTIVAVSTPIGSGGISIVRMSGSNSFSIAKKIISKIKNNDKKFEMRKMYLCKIDAENFSDMGLVVFFKGPDSFTGEDMVEFQLHGGVHITDGVIKKCLSLGAEMAEGGEFSKRAFLNGKTSLESLEGVIDLISSESDEQAKAAFALTSGSFYKEIKDIQNNLTNTLAQVNVALDYPDEDLEVDNSKEIKEKLILVKEKIENLIESYSSGKIIKHGINCAIIGLPNAGKSSLLNSFLNEERAIVSSIAGTTRDVIKESFVINGLKVNLIDTAGINDAKDEIEKIGVERAIKEAENADVVLFLFDGSKKFSKEDRKLLESLKNKNIILVKTKKDISINEKLNLSNNFELIEISSLTKENVNLLKEKIYSKFALEKKSNSGIIITNERHFSALKKASKYLDEILALDLSLTNFEIVSMLISNVYNALGEITGEVGSEKVIDEIFSKFCLGK